ncbi:MAG: 3D domain-containing protein [Actinobacteria bacterium]|nr:3D domain-containing protein [Actinomycetota bacterium]
MKVYSIVMLVAFAVLALFSTAMNLTNALPQQTLTTDLSSNGIYPFGEFTTTYTTDYAYKLPDTLIKDLKYETFLATAYAANDFRDGTDGIGAMGTEIHFGDIAVDPDVIPLGSWVLIKGYGIFHAVDTGGKIRGHRIDIAYPTHEDAIKLWGTRYVQVAILINSEQIN